MAKPTYASDVEWTEHNKTYGVKNVQVYGTDGSNLVGVKVNSDGELIVNTEPTALDMEAGGKIAVGTTAVEVTFTGATKSIIITADTANTGLLFVGESNVASDGSNSMTVLQPGESLTMDLDDSTNAVYVVSDTAAQNFYKGALIA